MEWEVVKDGKGMGRGGIEKVKVGGDESGRVKVDVGKRWEWGEWVVKVK